MKPQIALTADQIDQIKDVEYDEAMIHGPFVDIPINSIEGDKE